MLGGTVVLVAMPAVTWCHDAEQHTVQPLPRTLCTVSLIVRIP